MNPLDGMFILIGHILSFIGLGIVIGFSPVLYVTHTAILAHSKHPIRYSLALVAGMVTAILLLAALAELIQPDSIHTFIRSGINAVISYTWFDYAFGVLFIIAAGYYHFKKPPTHNKKTTKSKKLRVHTEAGIYYSIGFAKTAFSVTGFGAVLLGVRLVHSTDAFTLIQLILFAILIAAALLPYALLLFISIRWKKGFHVIRKLSKKITEPDYRKYLAIILLLIGGVFIIIGILS